MKNHIKYIIDMSHPNLTIEIYSDKSFVVRASKIDSIVDSEIKSILEMGGKWNSNLKGGGGWIFPNFKKKVVENYINGVEKKVFRVATSKIQRAVKYIEMSFENYPNNLKLKGGSIIKYLNDCKKSDLTRHFNRFDDYYGWQVNALVEDLSVPRQHTVMTRYDQTYFIYADIEIVKKWLEDINLIYNPHGPIEKKYSMFDGKLGVYFRSFWTGD
jgi:hypothetical protein